MESEIDKVIFERYPWINGGQEYLNEEINDYSRINNISYDTAFVKYMESMLHSNPKIIEDIRTIFFSAINKKEEIPNMIIKENKSNLIMFHLIKMILTVLNQKFLDNHVANLLSNIYTDNLKRKDDNEIKKLANYMGIVCELSSEKIGEMKVPFKVDVIGFVRFSSLFKDPKWALVNQYVKQGHVYILRDTLIRSLKELIRTKIIPQRRKDIEFLLNLLKKISLVNKIIEEIKLEIDTYHEKIVKNGGFNLFDSKLDGTPNYQEMPPCIKYILDKAENGQNLTHSERLHIAFFYANVGFTVEETIDVFRTVPDFNEEIARYNVEFSRGIGGKGKKYMVYSCSKLKSEHLCQESHPIFGSYICKDGVKKKDGTIYKIKTPLDYIFWYRIEQTRKEKLKPNEGDQNFKSKTN